MNELEKKFREQLGKDVKALEQNDSGSDYNRGWKEGTLWAFQWFSRQQQWIRVKDRLPETIGLYLISKTPDPKRTVEYLIDVTWYHPESPFSEFTTHWMPLPPKP